MKYRYGFFFLLCIAFLSFPLYSVQALDCTNPGQTGGVTINTNCAFLGSVTGVINGDITISSGYTLTVSNAQTVVFSSGNKINKTATPTYIVFIGTGIIVKGGKICLPDVDGDTYPSSIDPAVQTYQATACPAGTIARDAVGIHYQADCLDSNPAVQINASCYADADMDTYTTGGVISVCGTSSTCGTGYRDAANGADCNDGTTTGSTVWAAHDQCYANMDIDPETLGLRANTTCLNTSSCTTATKASLASADAAVTTYTAGQINDAAQGSNSDCNDNDGSYYHGNGSWYSDSGDHDCSGGIEKQYGVINCTTCDPGNGHSGRRDDNGGLANDPGCGGNADYYISLHWGCYDSTTCPNQYSSSKTQGCH